MSAKFGTLFVCLAAAAQAAASQSSLPIVFEPNQGQAGSHADFVARQGAKVSLLAGSEAELALGAVPIRLRFVGAGHPSATPFDRLAGTSNYLQGRDSRSWKTAIPQYGGVRYTGLYAGTDLVYHERAGHLEYDFVLAPGADPRRIAIQISGVDRLTIKPGGDLRMEAKAGVILQHRPIAYQDIHGQRSLVAASFWLDSAGAVRFELGAYDRSRTLVIDPTLDYSSYFGGSGASSIYDVKVDANGDVYMVGDAPPPVSNAGPFSGSSQTPLNAFVMKFSPARNTVLFFTSFGGTSFDTAGTLAIDAAGNVTVGGSTISSDFPLKNPANIRTKTIFFSGFVTKFAPDGRTMIFSTYLGGDGIDNLKRVVTDVSGNTYVCGDTTSQDFPLQNGLPARFLGFSLTSLAFLTKLSPTGSILYSGLYGGLQGDNRAQGLAVDGTGNVYFSGSTSASDFPIKNALPGTSASPRTTPVQFASWLAKVGANGNSVTYSTFLTAASADTFAPRLALDAQGNLIVAGWTTGPIPIRNAVQPTYGGNTDGYVMKINAAGTDFLYSTYLGGLGAEQIWGLALGSDGTAYAAGWTTDGSFPQKDSVQPYRGKQDSFVTAISPSGDRIIYSSLLGGSENEYAPAIAVDLQGNAYVTGKTISGDFPTKNAYQQEFPTFTNPAGAVGYLYKLSAVSTTPPALQLNPSAVSFQTQIGGPALSPQTLLVAVAGNGPSTPFTVNVNSQGGRWLTVTPTSGTTPAQLTLRADPTGLTPGAYQASVDVIPQGTGGIPATASVSLRVYAASAVLTSISPAVIPQYSPDTEVTILGQNISPSATAAILLPFSVPLPVKVVDSSTVRATIPSQYLATPNTYSLSVTNPNAQPSGLLTVIVAPTVPFIRDGGIVNSAFFSGVGIAPGELITLFGSDLSVSPAISAQFDSSGHLPTFVSGVRVLLDGQPAPLLYVSPKQINAIAPYGISGSDSVQLQLELNGQKTVSVRIPVVPSAPGVFTATGNGSGQGAILNQTYTVNSEDAPASPGSIVMIYATGAGMMNGPRQDGTLVTDIAQPAAPVTAQVDGRDAEVLYAGSAPGLVEGLLQVNVRIPPETRLGTNIPVVIRVGSASSQPNVTLSVK